MQITRLYELAKISKRVQERLFKCAILGTEITVTEDGDLLSDAIFTSESGVPSSVEASLVAKAYRRGIVNVEIDADNRDELLPSSGLIAKLSLNCKQNRVTCTL